MKQIGPFQPYYFNVNELRQAEVVCLPFFIIFIFIIILLYYDCYYYYHHYHQYFNQTSNLADPALRPNLVTRRLLTISFE